MNAPDPSQLPDAEPVAVRSAAGQPAPASPPPGYPQFPQGGAVPYGYLPYPTPAYPAYPYPYAMPYPNYPYGGYGVPGYGVPFPRPRRDTYQLTVGIISIILLSLVLIGGLLIGLVLLLAVMRGSNAEALWQNQVIWTLFPLVGGVALIGGSVGLYFAIRALMRRPSAVARPPTFLVPLGLTVVVLAAGVVQHALQPAQGPAIIEAPLILLSGILPALAIFALTSERLGSPSTWRHVWMSFLSGMFLATLIAIILELIASVVLALVFQVSSTNVTQINTNSSTDVLFTFLIISVVAPLAEEGFKPVGPLVIIGRIRGPAEAFLLGMASGIGFDIFETTGYIGPGQADWIIIAIERVGAGLLHGVGAGMATLGWYYIFRGRGVSRRYLKGFGAVAYAVAQHAIFNGSNLLAIIPGPIGEAMRAPVWFFGLPETGQIYLVVVIYGGIIAVLLTVTARIRRSPLNQSYATNTLAVVDTSPAPSPQAVPATPAEITQRGHDDAT